ncbi:Y-family DNA polymerase [Chitinophaga sancti]|uniref:DNA polymerase Y family protein n=1 Tax=Chitinophaga sancti TaxID=1004 RepID=A0A1K1SSU4_9BACT|nr:DNA polymerase Y family protein [Chitinophaga sancti]WQD65411.1 DNA polymerase Y family protein [Chitinophaga sancti]WQG88966.1 DNA polymerase Y family protein [Chitinophaga sancti]SFW87358.1 protein ImuB [Chitinophaga sancti]
MHRRYVSIWFPFLLTDWYERKQPASKRMPLVFVISDHGRLMVSAANEAARKAGVDMGMAATDAKALVPGLLVVDEPAGQNEKLLRGIGEWCIRFSPVVAIDLPDGLLIDASGCAHLWAGEDKYLSEITYKLNAFGYTNRVAIADTAGCAWAIARFSEGQRIVVPGEQLKALLPLPPASLRPEKAVAEKFYKLGFYHISSFIHFPRPMLRRRFGEHLLLRIAQALGQAEEYLLPLKLQKAWEERLPCLEPISTRVGIEIAASTLLEKLCSRLAAQGLGIRQAVLRCYRVDGEQQQVEVGTGLPSDQPGHLFKLLELKIGQIAPGLGIELFLLEARKVEKIKPGQHAFWSDSGLNTSAISELLDRLAGKFGADHIHRFLPQEHYWPERSFERVDDLRAQPTSGWREDITRPVWLLGRPEPIEVMAPIPDYPPILFIYKGRRHQVKKADGPERIEREWWMDEGEHRDYFVVEDEDGKRYWLFRSGYYDGNKKNQWFIHGFFA